MLYQFLATALALIHLAFILLVALGALLVLRWRWVMYIQLPAAIWGAIIQIAQWECPLTTWENAALRRAGEAGYADGFIAHHIFGLIYPNGLTRTTEIAIAIFVTVVNSAVYHYVFRGRSGSRRETSGAGRA